MLLTGATDTAVFEVYIEKVLVPSLHPGEVVVMDNRPASSNRAGTYAKDEPIA